MVQVLKKGTSTNNNNSNTNRNRNYNNNNYNKDRNNTNSNNNKRKWDDNQGDNATQPPPKRQEVARAYAAGPTEKKGYNGTLPKCNKCQTHHNLGDCPRPCGNCGKVGHYARDCRAPRVADNQKPPMTCFGCGGTGHFKNNCPKGRNQG